MKKVTGWVVLCAVFSVASVSLGGYVDEDWDSGFSDGAALGGQWSGSAIVSNSAAYLASGTAATNTVTVTPGGAPSKIWTDFDITPALGVEPTAPATSDSSTLFYFNADGRIVVWNAGEDDWSTCTTDVWGGSVDVIDAQVRVSIYQDYTDDTFALFLDGQCLIQDVDFPAGASSTLYSKFVIANTDSNAVVDDVYVHVTAPSGHTTKNDIDLGHASDVLEMDELGHVARTLYVKNGGTPEFDTISEAVAVARTGDEIKIGAAYLTTDEPVVLSNNVAYVFNGAALETGAFTANGDVTFESNADLDSLAIANGVTVTGASGIDIDAAALTMVAGALLDVTSGSFSEADAGLELEGSFQIDGGDWVAQASGIAPRELIINETFETYVDGKGIDSYGVYGWGGSGATIGGTDGRSGGKGLVLPDGSVASNLVTGASGKIWTTYYIKPALGAEPSVTSETDKSFMSYVNTNGMMEVREGDAWVACDSTIGTSPHEPDKFTSGNFKRVAIFQDFELNEFALFIANGSDQLEIVKERIEFPDVDAPDFSAFIIENEDNTAYIDDIVISTVTPSGGLDLDGDGELDTVEIAVKGLVSDLGTIFKFI